jgi:aspartyl-tRNA(Asn)/glutamyl-tRNA(Gln) amidotransferase subunit A
MIKELNQKLTNKEISAKELAEQYLNRIQEKNSELNAYITITEKQALEQAEYIDKYISENKEISILSGIPASIKDVIMTEEIQTTAGSKILEKYIAPYDATVVNKLKEQGLVMLGKNNCDEFAMGSSGENSGFGSTKNPHDVNRVSGGSSSGSAAAVAADMAVYSIGTDTGGSVRQPAAFCGVVGFKPTYGAISRYGLIAMASSLDQAGIIAKTVEDAEIVFDNIKGKDKLDSTSIDLDENIKNLESNDLRGIKIGIPKEYFIKGLDKEIEDNIKNTVKKAEELGAEIVEVSLPNTEHALAVYYIIMPSEVSANLARFDGIRYGQKQDADNLFNVYAQSRAKYLGDEVKRRIMLGTYALSAGYYDAYYKKAQQVRTLIKQDFAKVFDQVDILITPTTPTPPWKLGEKTNDPLTMYLEDVFTVPVNVAGLPAISIPCGKTKDNLPIGVQLIGKWASESKIFSIAKNLENVLKYTNS